MTDPLSTRAQLEQTQARLDLILALDQIRDSASDPAAMLASIARVLADRLHADLCLISLIDRETGALELKAISERRERLPGLDPDTMRALAEHACRASAVTSWDDGEELAGVDLGEMTGRLRVAVAPIIMGPEMRLGGALLARKGEPFSQHELDLLEVAESQLDSAVTQGYAYYELKQRNKELEVIYAIDHIRDKQLPFDEMLDAVQHQLRDVIGAEMGFIMLYDHAGKRLEMRAFTHDDLFRASPYAEAVGRVAHEALQEARLIAVDDPGGDLGAIMCIPLILRDEILGVFGVANTRGARTFNDEDRRLLTAIASQMDTAIFESLEQRRLRQVLGRKLDPQVMERLMGNPDVAVLKGERMMVTVLYADIRGSTSLAERTNPELLVGFVNDYLGTMVDVILSHEGTLDKFVGDEVMALFGAPFPQPDQALRSVRVGLAMQSAYQGVMDRWAAKGVEPSPIGIGIATGELIAGEMGSAQRSEYTVIGSAANLGARICGSAPGGQVWISEATYDAIKDQVEARPIAGLEMKGVGAPVTAYHVARIR